MKIEIHCPASIFFISPHPFFFPFPSLFLSALCSSPVPVWTGFSPRLLLFFFTAKGGYKNFGSQSQVNLMNLLFGYAFSVYCCKMWTLLVILWKFLSFWLHFFECLCTLQYVFCVFKVRKFCWGLWILGWEGSLIPNRGMESKTNHYQFSRTRALRNFITTQSNIQHQVIEQLFPVWTLKKIHPKTVIFRIRFWGT